MYIHHLNSTLYWFELVCYFLTTSFLILHNILPISGLITTGFIILKNINNQEIKDLSILIFVLQYDLYTSIDKDVSQ